MTVARTVTMRDLRRARRRIHAGDRRRCDSWPSIGVARNISDSRCDDRGMKTPRHVKTSAPRYRPAQATTGVREHRAKCALRVQAESTIPREARSELKTRT